jgi:hypothetical protein
MMVIDSSPSVSFGMPNPGPIIITDSFDIGNNTLLLSLKSMLEQTVVLNKIIFKDYKGQDVVAADVVPTELQHWKTRNIAINLGNSKLNSGIEYKAIFYTTEGGNYSYSFSIPINAKITKISLQSANTLLLDIQSLSNFNTVIDTVSISELSRSAIPSGQIGYLFRTIIYASPVAAELSAHENTTITVNLNNMPLSPGNYTLNFNGEPSAHGGGLRFDVTGVEPGAIEMEAGVQKVSFDNTDNRTLLLDVHSFSKHAVFVSSVTIKEISAKTEEVKQIKTIPEEMDCVLVNIFSNDISPTELPAYKDATIRINLNNMNLSSGNYMINFDSKNDNRLWAYFTIQ